MTRRPSPCLDGGSKYALGSPSRSDSANQHMAGVTTALRLLFGGELGASTDNEGELPSHAGR